MKTPNKKSLTTIQKKYAAQLRQISQEIVKLQNPIRILNAIRWPARVDEFLLKNHFKIMPSFHARDYEGIHLGFDPTLRGEKFIELARQVSKKFGPKDKVGHILLKTCEEYALVCEMLIHRGTANFGDISKKLYGSAHDKFHDDKVTVKDLSFLLKEILGKTDLEYFEEDLDKKNLTAKKAAGILNDRFSSYFKSHQVYCEASDEMVADAAAGNRRVLLNSRIRFSHRDVNLLEVHEGWAHIGTTLNGRLQPYAKWLAKGAPRVTSTQEGLALMMEIFTFRATPKRTQRILDRLYGIYLVEQGANIIELAGYYKDLGYEDEAVLYNIRRIFRGASFEGGYPFTKDLSYAKGFVENYNFIRSMIAQGKPDLIPFLFVGKLHVADIPALYDLYEEGLLKKPRYLPSMFADLNGLAVWMSYSNFFNQLNLGKIKDKFKKMLI